MTPKKAKAGPKGSAPKKPSKASRARLRWPGWEETLPLKQFYFQILMQAARMVTSSDAHLAAEGRGMLEDAAERVAEAEIYKAGQASRREDKPGSADDSTRNKRIRAAYVRANGERGIIKRLAIDFDLTTKTVSDIVKNERIAIKATK